MRRAIAVVPASFWAARGCPQGRRQARLGQGARRDTPFGLPTARGCGSISGCGPPGAVARCGPRGDCPARSSDAHLAVPSANDRASASMERVVIGSIPTSCERRSRSSTGARASSGQAVQHRQGRLRRDAEVRGPVAGARVGRRGQPGRGPPSGAATVGVRRPSSTSQRSSLR